MYRSATVESTVPVPVAGIDTSHQQEGATQVAIRDTYTTYTYFLSRQAIKAADVR